MNNRYLLLLRDRPGYRNLWLASLVSLLGDWFNTIASVMIVNRYTETDLAISWILIARTLPRFLLVPLSGMLADRFNRRTIMMVSDVLRAGIVLCFLLVDRPERIWLIYVLTVAQFVVASFFEPAANAIIPKLVEGKQAFVNGRCPALGIALHQQDRSQIVGIDPGIPVVDKFFFQAHPPEITPIENGGNHAAVDLKGDTLAKQG